MSARIPGATLLLLAGLALTPPSGLLLAVATTAGGRWTALAFLLAGLGCLVGAARLLARRTLRPVLIGAGSPALLALAAACLIAPTGQPDAPPRRLHSVWLNGARYPRWGLANLVPEVDQFTLGSWLLSAVDAVMDPAQAARVRATFQQIYGELRADPEFLAVGSSMPRVYRELLTGQLIADHLYLLLPDGPGPHPTAIFLHGSLGPFKGYQWVLADLSARCDLAIVSPDMGAGMWWRRDPDHPEQMPELAAIERALEWIGEQPALLPGPWPLIGLSNGGIGVTRAALHSPERFRQLVYLNGVIEPEWMPAVGATGLPVTVLDAGADRRIPRAWVDHAVRPLPQLTRRTWPEADHFMMFTHRHEVVDALAETLCP